MGGLGSRQRRSGSAGVCQVKGGCHLSLTKALFTWWEYNNNIRNLFPAHNVLNGSQTLSHESDLSCRDSLDFSILSRRGSSGGFCSDLWGHTLSVKQELDGQVLRQNVCGKQFFTWIVEPVLSFKVERVVLVWWPLKMELFYSTWSFLSSKIPFLSLLTVFVGPHVC